MGLELYVEIPSPADALWVSSAGPVVIKRLLEQDGLRR